MISVSESLEAIEAHLVGSLRGFDLTVFSENCFWEASIYRFEPATSAEPIEYKTEAPTAQEALHKLCEALGL